MWWLLGVGGIALLAGCGEGSEPSSQDYQVTDGWTGEVVVHTAEDLADAPRLELVEQLRIGSLDGPAATQFFRVMDAAVVGGEIWVLDGGHGEVRVFDLGSGDPIRTVGRRGEGPGEFPSAPSDLDLHGDTVVVTSMMRLNFFGPDGSELGTAPGMTVGEAGLVRAPRSAGPHWYRTHTPDGMTRNRPTGVLYRDSVYVYSTAPGETTLSHQIFSYPSEPRYLFDGPDLDLASPMFSASPVFAGGLDGRIYYSPGDEYRVDILDAGTGEPIRRIVNTMPLAPVTTEMVEGQIAEDREILANADPSPELNAAWSERQRVHALPVPEHRTVVGLLQVAPTGAFMLHRSDLDPNPLESGDPIVWDLYDPEGQIIGQIETPPRSRVRHFTGSEIIAVEADELDVQQVVMYGVGRK